MKTSQIYFDEKRNKIEIWNENVNGISESITERKYNNRIKKYSLKKIIA